MSRLIIAVALTLSFAITTFGLTSSAPVAQAQVTYSQKIYVNGGAPSNSQSLNIVDPVSGKVSYITNFINGGLETSPDGTRLYVSSLIPNNGTNAQIQVLDTATNAVVDNILTPTCSGAVVSSDGTQLLSTSSCRDNITLIDVASHAVLKTIPVGRAPSVATLSADGKTAYVPITNSCYICNPPGSLWVVDLASETVTAKIPVGFQPGRAAVNSAGTKAYVPNYSALSSDSGGTTVSVIDLTKNTKITDVTVGRQPTGVTVTPNGQKVYVASQLDNWVTVIDGSTNKVIRTIPVGNGPRKVVITPDGSKAYVANGSSQSLSVIDTTNDTVIQTLPKVSTMGPNDFAIATTSPVIQKTAVVLIQGIGTDLSAGEIQTMQQSCGQTDIFPKIVQALNQSGFPCSNLLLYSYTGGSVNSNGHWVPNPYSCDDTANQSIFQVDVPGLQTMLRLYQQAHPDTKIVLIGHSLGGVIAFQTSAFTSFPSGTIPAVVTIDSPLNHTSAINHGDAINVIPDLTQATILSCKLRALESSVPAGELADILTNSQTIRAQEAQIVSLGHLRGTSYMTTGNNQDCLWYLTLCNLPRITPTNMTLGGDWIDDRLTMIVDNADSKSLYNLGTTGCDLSSNLPFSLSCLPNSHGLAYKDSTVILDILNFVKGRI